jgi:ribosome biogenesis protein UTP30
VVEQKGAKTLLQEEDKFVHLTFTMTEVPANPTPRPFQISLPHPFNSKEHSTRVCVFVKDPASAFKAQISDLKIPCIAKVMGLDKLKRNFKQFKDKRQLVNDYDAFLADIRIYKMLPEALGREFYAKKKYPCPVKLHGFKTPKDLQRQLNHASKAAFFMGGNGPNYSLKVGTTAQSAQEVAENVETALAHAIAYVTYHDGIKFSRVSQVTVRAGEAPELPVFNQLTQSEVLAYIDQ